MYPARGHRLIAEFYVDLDYADDEVASSSRASTSQLSLRSRRTGRCVSCVRSAARGHPLVRAETICVRFPMSTRRRRRCEAGGGPRHAGLLSKGSFRRARLRLALKAAFERSLVFMAVKTILVLPISRCTFSIAAPRQTQPPLHRGKRRRDRGRARHNRPHRGIDEDLQPRDVRRGEPRQDHRIPADLENEGILRVMAGGEPIGMTDLEVWTFRGDPKSSSSPIRAEITAVRIIRAAKGKLGVGMPVRRNRPRAL